MSSSYPLPPLVESQGIFTGELVFEITRPIAELEFCFEADDVLILETPTILISPLDEFEIGGSRSHRTSPRSVPRATTKGYGWTISYPPIASRIQVQIRAVRR